MKKLILITHEYGEEFCTFDSQKCDGQGAPLFHISEDEHKIRIKYGESGEEFTVRDGSIFKMPPDDRDSDGYRRSARFLGLHPEQQNGSLVLKAHWFVGITRLPVEEGEIIVQVKPKIENLDLTEMFMNVLSHPVVSAHFRIGDAFHIDIDEEPIEMEEVPREYLLFLALQYMYVLNNLVKRGLQKGYRRKEENLRGRVRGRILVGRTVRENWSRGRKHYVYSSFMEYSADNLENRILKAAFLKARSYLFHNNVIHNTLAAWIGRISLDMEQVATTRIYPSDFSLTNVQRIRRDYDDALKLAKIILRHLGYDPTVKTDIEKSLRKVHPYWIDMNELFERYVEVELRRNGIKGLENWQVFPGYGRGEGINIKEEVLEIIEGSGKKIKELRPDFVLIKDRDKDREVIIGDAKYKEDYKEGWIKEDLQQIALYGRIKWNKIKEWIEKNFGQSIDIERNNQKNNKDCPGLEPELYIFYPCTGNCKKEPDEGKGQEFPFRGIHKVGVEVPIEGKSHD